MLYHFEKGEGDLVINSALMGLFSAHISQIVDWKVFRFVALHEAIRGKYSRTTYPEIRLKS